MYGEVLLRSGCVYGPQKAHWLEAVGHMIGLRHQYGHDLHIYYDVWSRSENTELFFYWLDIGEGKEVNLEKCPRSKLQSQCIKYLGHKERHDYEVVVESGRLVYKQTGVLLHTLDDSKWIFFPQRHQSILCWPEEERIFSALEFSSWRSHNVCWKISGQRRIFEGMFIWSVSSQKECHGTQAIGFHWVSSSWSKRWSEVDKACVRGAPERGMFRRAK